MKDEFISRVGLWGQRHYNFLKKNNPTVINVMRLNGTLEQYLTDLDRLKAVYTLSIVNLRIWKFFKADVGIRTLSKIKRQKKAHTAMPKKHNCGAF